MNIIELLHFFGSNVWLYVGTFVLVLSILVFVHEWGHYIVAKICGVKVEVFSIGFGRELFGFNDKTGTRWKLCLIPLGGYVKLYGDVDPASARHSDATSDEPGGATRPMSETERRVAFFSKPVSQRAAIVFAGPAINYIFAIIILTLLFIFSGQPVTPPLAAAIVGGSSADRNGFEPNDTVLSIDGKAVNDFEDIRREMMISLDERRHFRVQRHGREIDIFASPEKIEISDRFGFKHSTGLLGLISPRHAIDIKTITKVDGVALDDTARVRKALLNRMGSRFAIEVKAGEKNTDTLIIRPEAEFNAALASNDEEAGSKDLLYVAANKPEVFVRYSPVVAFGKAVQQSWEVTKGTLKALGQMVMGTRSPTELGGVIRIGTLAGDMARQGLVAFVLFTALLSINLGLINLFPIPILDGGHLVFYTLEALMGRPVPDHLQEYAFRFGFAFLVCLMVYANLSDIMQLIL